jgi:ABC-type multidrug transport system fused ATPase/permease subunit
MRHGRILDGGSHKELLKRNRVYANLYDTQFRVALAS